MRLDPCANVADVSRRLREASADAVVVDVTTPNADLARTVREIRDAAPHTALIALVRAGAAALSADALLAGADDTLAKHREFHLLLPAIIAQANARRQPPIRREAETPLASRERPAAAMSTIPSPEDSIPSPEDSGHAPPIAGRPAADARQEPASGSDAPSPEHGQAVMPGAAPDEARERLREAEAARDRMQARLAEREDELARLHVMLATSESEHHDREASNLARLADLSGAREQYERREEAALAQIAMLQTLLEDAAISRQRLERELAGLNASMATVAAEREVERKNVETLSADLASLRAVSDAHHRDQAALADVRQQMARLQTDAAAIEFQRRALTDANERSRRLQQALEEALVAQADLQHQLRDKEGALTLLGEQLDEARAVVAEHESLTADLQAAVDAAHAAALELAKLQQDRNDATLELARERALHAEAQQLRAAADAAVASLSSRLAGVEEDLATARSSLSAMADERNALKQSFVDVSGARTQEAEAVATLLARVAELEAGLAGARAEADARAGESSALRSALEAARVEAAALRDRLASADASRSGLLDDEQRLREQVTHASVQVADHRRRLAELEAEREHLRDALVRADAGAQLIAGRHLDERDAVQRALDELRSASAQAEARWAAQRAEFEHALAARADQHRRLAESGVIGLATTATEGQLLRCNDVLARFCGYPSADDLLRHPEGIVLPLPVDWPGFARHLGTAAGPVIVDSCVQHPDGRVAWLQAGATLVSLEGHASVIEWTVVDATDRYLRLRQLRQARRLDAIRELTVSAGREIAEQLGAASDPRGTGDATSRPLVHRGVARARDVAQQLVTFAQKQARLPQLLDVNETTVNLQPTLRRLAGEDVTIDTALAPGALVVSTDPAETEQWMTSLVVACRDALPSGGTLTLATRPLDLASAGTGGERRITPAAQVSVIACGLGNLPMTVSASLSELLAHRGATVRPSHDVASNTTRVDVYLPLVRPTRPADAPFPLVRSTSVSPAHEPA